VTSHDILAILGAGTLLYHAVELLTWVAARARAHRRLHRLGNLSPAAAGNRSGISRSPRPGTLAVLCVLLSAGSASADPAPAIEVHFSPSGGCTAAVTQLIDAAHASVRLAGYQFTSEPVAQALIRAHGRGRDVQLVVDRSSGRSRHVAELRAAGVVVFIDSRHHIFHDKFVVVDGATVETGSFNYTDSAERSNAENCIVIRSVGVAGQYAKNWSEHAVHSDGGAR